MLRLLRQRNLGLLWAAGLISMIGDWMLIVGLPIEVYRLTGSVKITGAVLIVSRIPAVVFGSVAGVFVDRWDRQRTMVVTDFARIPVLLALLLVRDAGDVWVAYGVAFLAATARTFFGPAESALMPRLADEADLVSANTLNSLNDNLSRLIGPAVAGLVVGYAGLSGVAIIDAATFLVSGLLISAIRPVGGAVRADRAAGDSAVAAAARHPFRKVADEWVAGLRIIGHDRTLCWVFGAIGLVFLGEGVFSLLINVFVVEVYGGGGPELGWLFSAQAVGGFAGAALIGNRLAGCAPVRLFGLGCVGLGLGDMAIFNAHRFDDGLVAPMVLFVAVGVPAVALGSGYTTMIQRRVADSHRGRVFGAIGAANSVLLIVGSIISGAVSDRLGAANILGVYSLLYVLAGWLVLARFGSDTGDAEAGAMGEAMTDPGASNSRPSA